MSVGLMAPAPRSKDEKEIGTSGPGINQTRQECLGHMKTMINTVDIDILLASAANAEVLAKEPGALKKVTLAVRGNDSTDI